jgi:hypothetical protein
MIFKEVTVIIFRTTLLHSAAMRLTAIASFWRLIRESGSIPPTEVIQKSKGFRSVITEA